MSAIVHAYACVSCLIELDFMSLMQMSCRYLSIVKDEGLEISQPALDPVKSEVHHPITARRRNSKAHRFVSS